MCPGCAATRSWRRRTRCRPGSSTLISSAATSPPWSAKDPDHYRPHFPDVPDDLPYVWPVRSPAVLERERRRAGKAAAARPDKSGR